MSFGHEKLDVYRLALAYIGWVHTLAKKLSGSDRFAREQLVRAALSIPLNMLKEMGERRTLTGVVSSRLRADRRWSVRPPRMCWKSAVRCRQRKMPKRKYNWIVSSPC